MSRKLPYTPRSRVRQSLRMLWLRSRERSEALKRTGYTCELCGVRQSMAKGKEVRLEVHHVRQITNWDHVIDTIYQEILCNPEHLQPLCPECHKKVGESADTSWKKS